MGTLREIVLERGVPFVVVRAYTHGNCRKVMKELIPVLRRARTLGELLLSAKHRVWDVRITTSFDPDHWFDPETWSKYGYPFDTFFNEKLDTVEIEVEPFNEENTKKFYAYMGLGIACTEVLFDKEYGEKAEPMLYAFIKPLRPRHTVVYEEDPPLTIHVYTAIPEIHNFFIRHGYTAVSPYELVKTYHDPNTMLVELGKLDNEVRRKYDVVETYMLGGLRRRVKYALKKAMIPV